MPKYFFDINNGDGLTRDEDGAEFAFLDEVRDAAIRVLPDIARDVLPDSGRRVLSVRVRDEDDRYVFHASLSLISEWLDVSER